MHGIAKSFDELRAFCEQTPLIDCHDHTLQAGPKHTDPLQAIFSGYLPHDLQSAGGESAAQALSDTAAPLENRWRVLGPVWERTKHTGYARVTRLVLKEFYDEVSLDCAALKRIQDKLPDFTDEKTFTAALDKAKIVARLEDPWPDPRSVLDGTLKLSPRGRLMIGLPGYHNVGNAEHVLANVAPLGRRVTSLGEYVEACREMFVGFKKYGAVGFKDQSAYTRSLAYGNPTTAEAEEVFNWFMHDPRRNASYPDQVKPLSDYLFHQFMRMARDLDLPVQIHTGHMARVRDEITKANAIQLTPLLELHRDVRFDLFHANWPYGGEILYLAKNYPNVHIDFCWANIIDPIYCQNLMKQVVSSVPHGKVHGFGSDYGGSPERAWAHATIARDNIAIALSDLVDMQYLDIDEAREVAAAWLFGNANEFFRLKLPHRGTKGGGNGRTPARQVRSRTRASSRGR
ncbi:MAG: amidohydrolase family protein [Chitinivibrionales bacterium]|nr:amidohydrolase family protein [Chitinivibrionales bacterium]